MIPYPGVLFGTVLAVVLATIGLAWTEATIL